MDFVDDLSTWYIRRSRERFKEMMRTTKEISSLLTTYYSLSLKWWLMPFLAEDVYQKVKVKSQSQK